MRNLTLNKMSAILLFLMAQKVSADLGVASAASSFQCPDWVSQRNNLPVCPPSGIVPEINPIAALVVSDQGYIGAGSGYEDAGRDSGFTSDVVIKALTGAGDKLPMIILPAESATYSRIISDIDSLKISEEKKRKFKRSILHVPLKQGFTWQQDYMQSAVDPKTGQLQFREVESYRRLKSRNSENQFAAISEALKKCGVASGPSLKPAISEPDRAKREVMRGGEMGGNIEALPGGICVLGDDHFKGQEWEEYSKEACPNTPKDKIVKAPTFWLNVGHSDEIMKVVRNKGKKEPCNFTVTIASPKKALELLRQSPNEVFADFSNSNVQSQSVRTKRRFEQADALITLCDRTREIRRLQREAPPKNQPGPAPSGGGKTVSQMYHPLLQILIGEANAGVELVSTVDTNTAQVKETIDCEKITNGEVARVISEDPELRDYNNEIQKQMDMLKNDVYAKLKSAMPPTCNPEIIEVPNLFYGGSVVTDDNGNKSLPNQLGNSFLPNPTNAISINNTIISPDPGNAAFKRYLEAEYKKRGQNPQFVDTFDYAHQGYGNLHCSTNTLHICKPLGVGR